MTTNKEGQILIVSLWILALLTVLAVSLGHRAAIGLKYSQHQADKLKTLAFAKAGLSVAFSKLHKDKVDVDSFGDVWAGSEKDFKEIRLRKDPEGIATVGYVANDDGIRRTVYGILDEDRKININKASRELLRVLLNSVSAPPEIADNICAWRGDRGGLIPDYKSDGYTNKGQPFTVPEELLLVKGVDREIYDRIEDDITVWGSGLVNVNTASRNVLDMLVSYSETMAPSAGKASDDLVEWIMAKRPFGSINELAEQWQEQGALSAGMVNLVNDLSKIIDVQSSHFRISSTGRIAHSKVVSTIECVLNRAKGRVVYWHEN